MGFEFKLIEKIRSRPAMFLGDLSITKLKVFIDGYIFAINDYNIADSKTIQPLPFCFFHEYVACCYNFYESTSGWLNMILTQVDNEEEGLALFFKLFDEFKQIKFEEIFSCEINQLHLEFHNNNECAPKSLSDNNFDIIKPLYQNPQKIYYVKLSNNIGYVGFVEIENKYVFIKEIYKTKGDIISYWQCCFGDSLTWQNQEYEKIDLTKICIL